MSSFRRRRFHFELLDFFSGTNTRHRRRPPPPRLPPPPRDPMLDAPRLLPERALDPLYPLAPRDPPPQASRFPPPPRETSRLPMRSAPPPPARLLIPAPARLPVPVPPLRALDRLPPCRPTCCRALAWRLESESPRAVPPNLSAVPRSRYGVPPRCWGLCCHRSPEPRPPAGRVDARLPPPISPRLPPPMSPRLPPPAMGFEGRLPPPMLLRLPPPTFVLRLKLLLRLMLMVL